MRILVTGGAGFIGRHVVEALLADGAEVRVLDISGDAEPPAGTDFVRGDVRHPETIERCLHGVAHVCHLAAKVGLGVDMSDLTDYASHNELGTAVLRLGHG